MLTQLIDEYIASSESDKMILFYGLYLQTYENVDLDPKKTKKATSKMAKLEARSYGNGSGKTKKKGNSGKNKKPKVVIEI